MKRSLVYATLGLSLFCSPSWGQEGATSARSPYPLDQAAGRLRGLAPDEAQAKALMDLFLRQLPRIMDEGSDVMSLAREVAPEAQRILDPDQLDALRTMESEAGPLRFGSMTREERRRLVRGGLERLSHPDLGEWLKRIDSFDI